MYKKRPVIVTPTKRKVETGQTRDQFRMESCLVFEVNERSRQIEWMSSNWNRFFKAFRNFFFFFSENFEFLLFPCRTFLECDRGVWNSINKKALNCYISCRVILADVINKQLNEKWTGNENHVQKIYTRKLFCFSFNIFFLFFVSCCCYYYRMKILDSITEYFYDRNSYEKTIHSLISFYVSLKAIVLHVYSGKKKKPHAMMVQLNHSNLSMQQGK